MIGEKLAHINLTNLSWKDKTWTSSDIENVFNQHAKKYLLILLDFKGKSLDINAGDLDNHIYLPSLRAFFSTIQQYFSLEGKLLLSLHDIAPEAISADIPMLSFSKHLEDSNTILIPDPYYLDNLGDKQNFQKIEAILSTITTENRLPLAYWRGSSTGFPLLTKDSWQENPRAKLCLFSKEIPDLLNAKLTRIVQADSQVLQIPELENITGPWEGLEQNLAFKFGIDIDGNTCSWGLFQKLYMDLAIIKFKSTGMQWYYPLLEEGKHILYANLDLEDIKRCIISLQENPTLTNKLSTNAKALAKELDYTQAFLYTGTLLKEILKNN